MAETASSKILGSLLSTTLGVSIALIGSFITVLSSSVHSRWVAQDAETSLYGFPLPWLSKGLGYAVLDAEGLLSQIRAPPKVDYQALLADLAFYALPASAVIYGIVGLIHASQYLARRLLRPRTRESLRNPETRRLAGTLGPPGLSFPSGYAS